MKENQYNILTFNHLKRLLIYKMNKLLSKIKLNTTHKLYKNSQNKM